jgi:hypothetical protein
MSLRSDWPYVLGAIGAAGFVGLLITRRDPIGVGLSTPAAAPPDASRGRIAGDAPITVFPGRTYFVAVETNGVVNAAANEARIKATAEKEGFRDVVVFRAGSQPREWPVARLGDYAVRGTFRGAAPKAFQRHVGVFAGSVNLLDAFEA